MTVSRFKTILQLDYMDCGPTCLQMIFNYYGKQVSLASLRKATENGTSGSSLLGMAEAAEKFGFQATGALLTFDQLVKDVRLPCIVFWNQSHYIVVISATTRKIKVADPEKGTLTYTKEDFLKNWVAPNRVEEKEGVALILSPLPSFYKLENEKTETVGWGTVIQYITNFKGQILQLFLGLLIGSVLQLILPYLTQSIVDTGINDQNLHFIQIVLLAQFTLFFARATVDFIRSRTLLFVSTHINLSIVSDFWTKLMRVPLHFFDSKQTGEIFQRINDHSRIENFVTGTALSTLFSLFNFVIFSIVLLFYNTTIFTVFMVGSLFYVLWISFFLKYRRAFDFKRFEISSKANSMTMQLINGIHEIKLNNAEQLKRREWQDIQASLFKINFRFLSLNQYQQAGAFFINEGKNIFITYLVATSVVEGNLTLGAMLAIQYIIGQLNSPIEQLISFSQQAQDAQLSLRRLNEIHQVEDEEAHSDSLSNHISDNHSIILKNLNYTYPGAGNSKVLSNINVEFPSGKVTAIVGMSGSGKTTILKLIQKFYQNYSGEIIIGENNLQYVSPRFWRSISGSVMQEGFIFNDTIEKNIAVGDESPDYKKLVHACKVANLLGFVETLPMRFKTRIGANGNGISAGQKQRILIARAVYKSPTFLFFDEATNALDASNEKVIIENLHEFFRGKTVIVVAHRLSTVKNADKVVVLEQGKVMEEGRHEELISKKGKYYELVRNQLELEN
jgi:ATP-binding cassette subfamily B protein